MNATATNAIDTFQAMAPGTRFELEGTAYTRTDRDGMLFSTCGTTLLTCTALAADGSTALLDIYPESVLVATSEPAEDDSEGCPGHESLNGADMGQSVYCDGSCTE